MGSASASLQYIGHSTVILATESGKRVVIDPWFSENPSCPTKLVDPGPIDFIAVTHAHFDHCGSAVELATKYQARVIAIYDLIGAFSADGLPAQLGEGLNKGGTVAIDGISFSLTHALHSSSYQAKDGSVKYGGEACGIVVTLESGRTVYHAGDTCFFSDLKLIGEEFHPTVALLPIGDRFTMSPKMAARAAALIKPQIVIPIHHSTFPLLTGTPAHFKELTTDLGFELRILEPGQSTSF